MQTEKYMTDSKGRLTPVDLVRPIDKERDDLVKNVVEEAKKLHAVMIGFKETTRKKITDFVSLSASKYKVKYGGQKGNILLSSYDGTHRVVLSIGEYITFDERLMIAKQLIDECINEWKQGAKSEVIALINQAFQVDKQGKINTGRILSLRRLNIKNAKWTRAMEAISDSITIDDTKEYIRIYERQPGGKYQQLPLDMSTV